MNFMIAKFKPFEIRYVTDAAETGDGSNNGFCLNFVQFWMQQSDHGFILDSFCVHKVVHKERTIRSVHHLN